MATLRITNVDSSELFLSDIYSTIAVGKYVDVTRDASDIPRMQSLASAIADGKATLAVTYSADELASGIMAPPAAIGAADMAPVASTDKASGLVLIRIPMTALAAGTADDVTGYAVNTLPFKFRVCDAWAHVSANIAASTLSVRTQAAGAGTLLATLSGNATGRNSMTAPTASAVATPGATEGLFVRRSDRAVAGEVMLLCRVES